MSSEKQYIDLYERYRKVIFDHSSDIMNAVRDTAFEDFKRQGFPSRKVERYRYTDIQEVFAPDYGLNLNRLDIPINPYEAFPTSVRPIILLLTMLFIRTICRKQRCPMVLSLILYVMLRSEIPISLACIMQNWPKQIRMQ